MLGMIGFSYIGLLFILMLTIPNLIWTKHQPIGYDSSNENKLLVFFERVGQVGVTTIALLTKNFNISRINNQLIWLFIAFIIMLLYECWWIKYFKSNKELIDFYSSFLGISVAGATLPVIAFFCWEFMGNLS